MEIQQIKIKRLHPNEGQIEGLPTNPRQIKKKAFDSLKKSIKDAPEMLHLRELIVYPYGDDFVVIGGNMRLRACRELGFEELPCKVLPVETPAEKLREYAIKDNVEAGEDDWDVLANEWNAEELTEWGMEIDMKDEVENPYTQKKDSPIYEITGACPTINDCLSLGIVHEKIERINAADIPEEQKEMLRACAYRFAEINFANMAEYYAHQNGVVQELMEESALIIIDYDRAIEMGLVELDDRMQKLYHDEV